MIRTVRLGSAAGLHMRAAAQVAAAAAEERVPVTVRCGEHAPVPADSVLGLLTLGVAYGCELTLEASGAGAVDALARLADLLSRELDVARA